MEYGELRRCALPVRVPAEGRVAAKRVLAFPRRAVPGDNRVVVSVECLTLYQCYAAWDKSPSVFWVLKAHNLKSTWACSQI